MQTKLLLYHLKNWTTDFSRFRFLSEYNLCSLPAKSPGNTMTTSLKMCASCLYIHIPYSFQAILFSISSSLGLNKALTVLRVLTSDVQPVVDVEGAEAVRRFAGVASTVLWRHVLDL